MMTFITFLMIVWLVYELAKYTASIIKYDEHWIARSFWRKLNAAGFAFMANNLVCGGLNFFIPTAIVLFFWMIAPVYHFWTRREFKLNAAREREERDTRIREEIAALEERKENILLLEAWLDQAPVFLYPQERDGFFHWLENSNDLLNFNLRWDEYLRLLMLGYALKREFICHLDHLTYEQKQARGDLAWKRIVQEKQGSSSPIEQKKTIQYQQPSEKTIRKRAEHAAEIRRIKEEEHKQWLAALRERGRQDKASYKVGR